MWHPCLSVHKHKCTRVVLPSLFCFVYILNRSKVSASRPLSFSLPFAPHSTVKLVSFKIPWPCVVPSETPPSLSWQSIASISPFPPSQRLSSAPPLLPPPLPRCKDTPSYSGWLPKRGEERSWRRSSGGHFGFSAAASHLTAYAKVLVFQRPDVHRSEIFRPRSPGPRKCPLRPGAEGRFSGAPAALSCALVTAAQMTNLESISVLLNRPIAKCTDRKMDFALLNRRGPGDDKFLRISSFFSPHQSLLSHSGLAAPHTLADPTETTSPRNSDRQIIASNPSCLYISK